MTERLRHVAATCDFGPSAGGGPRTCPRPTKVVVATTCQTGAHVIETGLCRTHTDECLDLLAEGGLSCAPCDEAGVPRDERGLRLLEAVEVPAVAS